MRALVGSLVVSLICGCTENLSADGGQPVDGGDATGGGTAIEGGDQSPDAGRDAGLEADAGEPSGADAGIVTALVGVDGGQLTSADGMLIVKIPAGAMSGEAIVSILPVASDDAGVGHAYDLQPSGLTFSTPIQLSFAVPAGVDFGLPNDLDAGLTDDVLVSRLESTGWAPLDTQLIVQDERRVEGSTAHFSVYSLRRVPPGCNPCGNFDPIKLARCEAQNPYWVFRGFNTAQCGPGFSSVRAWLCQPTTSGGLFSDCSWLHLVWPAWDCIDDQHDANLVAPYCSQCTTECMRANRVGAWSVARSGLCVGWGFGDTAASFSKCQNECVRTGQTTPQGCVRHPRTLTLVGEDVWWDGMTPTTVRAAPYSGAICSVEQTTAASGVTRVTQPWSGGTCTMPGVTQGGVFVDPAQQGKWFLTDAPTVDVGVDRAGAVSLPRASAGTTLTFDLSGAGGALTADEFVSLTVPRAGFSEQLSAAIANGVLHVVVPWVGYRVIDPASEYVVAIYRSTSTDAGTASSQPSRVFTARGLTMQNGANTSVEGSFLGVGPSLSRAPLEVPLDSFRANEAVLPPIASSELLLGVEVRPWGVAFPRTRGLNSGYHPDLLGWRWPLAGLSGTVTAPNADRDPFPATWPSRQVAWVLWHHDYLLPGTTVPASRASSMWRVVPTGPLRPTVPLVNASIDLQAFQRGGALHSLVPTLSWTPIPVGSYTVNAYQLSATGQASTLTWVGAVETTAPAIQLPHDLLQAGAKYVFCVQAGQDGRRDATSKGPRAAAVDDQGGSTTCSGIFTAPPCSAITCTFLGGVSGCCDASGVCQQGQDNLTCGSAGGACSSCSGGVNNCSGGACRTCSSAGSNVPVTLTFQNGSGGPVNMYWVNSSCNEVPDGTMFAGGTITYPGVTYNADGGIAGADYDNTVWHARSATTGALLLEYVVNLADAPAKTVVVSGSGQCDGCVLANNTCIARSNISATACGLGGVACRACAPGETCVNGTCLAGGGGTGGGGGSGCSCSDGLGYQDPILGCCKIVASCTQCPNACRAIPSSCGLGSSSKFCTNASATACVPP